MRLSKMGFGGMPAGNMYMNIGEEQAIKTLITAVKSGINFIDTAPWYNRSEDVIGKVSSICVIIDDSH